MTRPVGADLACRAPAPNENCRQGPNSSRMSGRMYLSRVLHAVAAVRLFVAASAFAQLAKDPFAEGVRPTEALSPEQERAAFHLPSGFEIQLFATEPQINKPINMAFD